MSVTKLSRYSAYLSAVVAAAAFLVEFTWSACVSKSLPVHASVPVKRPVAPLHISVADLMCTHASVGSALQ